MAKLITEEMIKSLNPKDIISAKVVAASTTHPNGKATLLVKEGDETVEYECGYNSDDEQVKTAYLSLLHLLAELKNMDLFSAEVTWNEVVYKNKSLEEV